MLCCRPFLVVRILFGAAGMACITPSVQAQPNGPQVINGVFAALVAVSGTGDVNGDGRIDLTDWSQWLACGTGPENGPLLSICAPFDFDKDNHADLRDVAGFQNSFGRNIGIPLDDCTNPMSVTDGETAFSTLVATTDGPEEENCGFTFNDPQIGSDIWFCYTATCGGEAVASLCGSDYDSKMAVYTGCDCPTEAPIVCSDDDCGAATLTSRVTFQATAGQSFFIRVGGFGGEQGDGILNVRCGTEVCGAGSGDCFAAGGNGSRGCDDADCCNTTCDVDPYCCDVQWDVLCAEEAPGLCSGSFAECAAGAGDCFADSGNGTGGCDDTDCCNKVCGIDPFCCVDTWDDLCASRALVACKCGDPDSGDCFESQGNGTPGCNDDVCCQTICTIDRVCCGADNGTWDALCAANAGSACP